MPMQHAQGENEAPALRFIGKNPTSNRNLTRKAGVRRYIVKKGRTVPVAGHGREAHRRGLALFVRHTE